METDHESKKWIWEDENFPHYIYDEVPLDSLYYKFSQLKMLKSFSPNKVTVNLR